ncbi:MAG: tripartite tricarboxylate transporter substrate binding protein [Hyphomicrobiaceae bacterium]|nr:tripartite tricarboxylate transporter substrate binding protein [Hyphomicrobiaceae bacterium]
MTRQRSLSTVWSAALIGALTAITPTTVSAEDASKFPSKPIEVVIHAKYGGGTDTTARMMITPTRAVLGSDMVVVSKQGGGGQAALDYLMSKPADGYTIIAITPTHLYTLARGKSSAKITDLVGVARAMDDPTFIVVPGKSPIKTLADLIKASKAKPLNWGVAQIGGTEHIGLAQFAKAAGIKYKPVALGSGMQMVQNLMSGAIDATLPNVSEAREQIASGQFRALAVMAKTRLKDFPNIPTTHELGFKVATSTVRGYLVRAGTPQPILAKLEAAMLKGLKSESFAKYLKTSGLNPDDSVAGSKAWTEQVQREFQIAKDEIKALGLTGGKKKK